MSDHYLMPSLGAGMTDGTVIEWYVEPGQSVAKGDVVGLVDTDKGAIEMEIWEDAQIAEILAGPGTKVPVGDPLLALGATTAEEPAEPSPADPAPAPPEADGREPERGAEVEDPETGPEAEPEPGLEPEAPGSEPQARVPSTPAARMRAAEMGLSLGDIEGTGPEGAVTLPDVERAAKSKPTAPPREAAAPKATPVARRAAEALGVDLAGIKGTGPRGTITREDVERVSGARVPAPTREGEAEELDRHAAMRRAIAAAMAQSKREIPHYYLAHTLSLERALRWLERTNRDRAPTERILQAALYLKAVSIAVSDFPELNGFWEDDSFRPAEAVHPGLAISLRGGGLVAPAVHDVAEQPLDRITSAVRDLVQRARAGRLRASEVTDATITVTSLGDRGVETVFGVIYPPQVSIVGVGAPMERPWAEGGMVGAHRTLRLTLSADHRASDGHRGSLFLERVAELLQTPENL